MLITKHFVMINFPKTGSTFARKAILRIHANGRLRRNLIRRGFIKPRVKELMMRQLYFTEMASASNPTDQQHAAYCQIPKSELHKTILSVVRNPFDRLISLYEFRRWALTPFPNLELLIHRYPNFPDITFHDFLDMHQRYSMNFSMPQNMKAAIGPLTVQFIRFYARNPLKTMLALNEGMNLKRAWDEHFPEIHFIHTEELNTELHEFLLRLGYPPRRIEFILSMDKANTTTRSTTKYFEAHEIEEIIRSERFFFQVFPEYLQRPS